MTFHNLFPIRPGAAEDTNVGTGHNLSTERSLCLRNNQETTDFLDSQLVWESRWEDLAPEKAHVLILGEQPFLIEFALARIRRHAIPMLQRYCLSMAAAEVLPGFRPVHKNVLESLKETDHLEIVGQYGDNRLLLLFPSKGSWSSESWGPAALASHLKQAGLRQIGTLHLVASWLGVGNFLPSLADELAYQGIDCKTVCAPKGIIRPSDTRTSMLHQKIRVIGKQESFSIAWDQGALAKWGPMLREGGPDFSYEIIAQVGRDPAVEEAAGTLVASSPFRTCWINWDPLRGTWRVLYGEPRFLQLNTRWVVIAPSSSCSQKGDLFAGLDTQSFAVRFLGFLQAVEAWQEIHGKLSHLLLVGANLFQPGEKVSGEFAFKLAQELAALGRRIQIRVRNFVQQKDIIGRLYSGHLTNESPFLQWSCHPPPWERDLHWDMGELNNVDAPVYEPEALFRGPCWSPTLAWQSSLEPDLAWIEKTAIALRLRENVRFSILGAYQATNKKGDSSNLSHWIPVLEIAALADEPDLLWVNVQSGETFSGGNCVAELREFEIFLQNLFTDLFAAFLVDGDFRLHKRADISSHIYKTALRSAFPLLCLLQSEGISADGFQRALEIRLCAEFLKNLGEKNVDKPGILSRAWRAISRNQENAKTCAAQYRQAILGAFNETEAPDEYELARIYQFCSQCIQTSPPALCWKDFSDPVPTTNRLLGNACESLSAAFRTSQDSRCSSNEAEEYFEKIQAAQKNSIGTFQSTPEGIFWSPTPCTVVREIDLRTPWLCFGTHFLYRSIHGGKELQTDDGISFAQVDHAAQLPFPVVWSRLLALDLWNIFGGVSREPLPMKPDMIMLPTTPEACMSYEWAPCTSTPKFSEKSAFKKIIETGLFHAVYREFDRWHVVQKLKFDILRTQIDIFLDHSTKVLIFPGAGSHSQIHYHFYGAGGNYRCLVRRGFVAEIECESPLERWTFQSSDGVLLKALPDSVEGDDISIRFIGIRPGEISIDSDGSLSSFEEALNSITVSPKGISSSPIHNLPGQFLGVVGDLHVRFEPRTRSLHTFCPQSLKALGPLKTIYAQTANRFDRVGIHDGSCFAVEYLLSSSGNVLEFTYRLSPCGWNLLMISTDTASFFTQLKQARRIKCPLDEFLLRWLNTDAILGLEEFEEEGMLPQLAEVVLVCSKSQPWAPLWVRTSDNSVIWEGHRDLLPTQDPQMPLVIMLRDQMRFLFCRDGEIFFKDSWDAQIFPIGKSDGWHHIVHHHRWNIASKAAHSAVYSLATVPLHIGWKVNSPMTESSEFNKLFAHPGNCLRHPFLGVAITSLSSEAVEGLFVDTHEGVAFSAPIQATDNEAWLLGREAHGGSAYWWLPRDRKIISSPTFSVSMIPNPNLPKDDSIRVPGGGAPNGAGIADGFLHVRTARGDTYRKLSDGSWRMLRATCLSDSLEGIFCELATVAADSGVPLLPLEMRGADKTCSGTGWFLHQTAQIIKAPAEAGQEALLLGSSADGEKHYVFGMNKIFEVQNASWVSYGSASFALRKNGILFLVVGSIADPPILNAQKLVLFGSSQCTRWKLGDALRSYRLIVVGSCSDSTISGIVDLRPLCIQDCGCWIDRQDVVIGEIATGNCIVIRNGTEIISPGNFIRKINIRFAEFEKSLSLQTLLETRGK